MDGVFKTFVEYLKIPSKKFIYTYIIVHKKKKSKYSTKNNTRVCICDALLFP